MMSKKWLKVRESFMKAIDEGASYADLGRKYGVTRERIRQVYNVFKNMEDRRSKK